MHEEIDYITLGSAAKLSPGRPSANTIWRWCRKGVKSRNGAWVRLQHVRAGSRIYTTARWLADFAQNLAEADTEYFDSARATDQGRVPFSSFRSEKKRLAEIEQAEHEMAEAGV
jgi:hypothetical protein